MPHLTNVAGKDGVFVGQDGIRYQFRSAATRAGENERVKLFTLSADESELVEVFSDVDFSLVTLSVEREIAESALSLCFQREDRPLTKATRAARVGLRCSQLPITDWRPFRTLEFDMLYRSSCEMHLLLRSSTKEAEKPIYSYSPSGQDLEVWHHHVVPLDDMLGPDLQDRADMKAIELSMCLDTLRPGVAYERLLREVWLWTTDQWVSTVVDASPPSLPTDLRLFTDVSKIPPSVPHVLVAWNAGTDPESGIRGYSYVWDGWKESVPDADVDIPGGTLSLLSPPLVENRPVYLHLRSINSAAVPSQEAAHFGPVVWAPVEPQVGKVPRSSANPKKAEIPVDLCSHGDAWIVLTGKRRGENLRVVPEAPESTTKRSKVDGRAYPALSAQQGGRALSLDLEESFAASVRGYQCDVVVGYLDAAFQVFGLEYDYQSTRPRSAGDEAYFPHPDPCACEGTGRWRTVSFHLINPLFQNRQTGGADFRLVDSSDQGRVVVSFVAVLRPAYQRSYYGPEPLFSVNASLTAEREEEMNLMRRAGLRYVRQDFPWRDLEPNAGHWSWSSYDHLVDAYIRRGIGLMPVFGQDPPWASGRSNGVSPVLGQGNRRLFGQYAAAVISRYRDRIHTWNVWDGIDDSWLGGDAQPRGDILGYVALCRDVWKHAKEADPTCCLVAGETEPETTAACLEAGLAWYADVYSVHGYAPEGLDQAETDLDRNHNLVEEVTPLPIWGTEMPVANRHVFSSRPYVHMINVFRWEEAFSRDGQPTEQHEAYRRWAQRRWAEVNAAKAR
jgi:hypothetical protein